VHYGLNWVSFVSAHPFEIVAVTAGPSMSLPIPSPKATQTQKSNVEVVAQESATLVAAQLPRCAISTSRSALQRTFPAQDAFRLPLHAQLTTGTCYVASVWCLCFSTTYTATLRRAEPLTEGENSAPRDTRLTFRTSDFQLPLDLRDESLHVVERGSLLWHPEFVQCITAQGENKFLFYLPTNLLDAQTALPFMHTFWYHGLFTLPQSVRLSPKDTLLFFLLPNGDGRYVLDFTCSTLVQRTTETSCSNNDNGAETVSLQEDPGCVNAPSKTNAVNGGREYALFPWRGHSKVRRVIKSGSYTVAVRGDSSGVMASLQRAYDYHLSRGRSSWIDPVFIRLMGRCCDAAPSTDTGGARLVSVELIDEAAGAVVAGCCGMAIGSVYHDYTMFTLRQCKDSLGTFLTKLLGEALQRCGYALWYWGFRVEYMADYEKHFGAVNLPRDVFYRRWCAARDVAPTCAVEAFLKDGRGMVPYTSKTPL
jgi:hypothetical protein